MNTSRKSLYVILQSTGGEPPVLVHKNRTGQQAFNLNNCREIHQLKRVTPHEFTYITVDKQAHEICK